MDIKNKNNFIRQNIIYPITDQNITKLSHLEIVKRLIDGGARLIQLRDKISTADEFYEAACSCIEFSKKHKTKIIINDRVDIALAAGADGVHLGQEDLYPIEARHLLGEEAIIGYSTHSKEQALKADKLPIDYIAIGPIFSTQTKSNAATPVGIEIIKKLSPLISKPLVAIGGITFSEAENVLASGASSIAMISNLLLPTKSINIRLREFLN